MIVMNSFVLEERLHEVCVELSADPFNAALENEKRELERLLFAAWKKEYAQE